MNNPFNNSKLPAILWGVLILSVSSIPKSNLPETTFHNLDKFIHAMEYLIFSILLIKYFSDKRKKIFIKIFFVGSIMAVIDELHQYLIPGRTPDILDIAADLFGLIIILILLHFKPTIFHRIYKDQRSHHLK